MGFLTRSQVRPHDQLVWGGGPQFIYRNGYGLGLRVLATQRLLRSPYHNGVRLLRRHDGLVRVGNVVRTTRRPYVLSYALLPRGRPLLESGSSPIRQPHVVLHSVNSIRVGTTTVVLLFLRGVTRRYHLSNAIFPSSSRGVSA